MKATEYIKKYMASKGPVFKNSTGKADKFDQDAINEDSFTEGHTVLVNGNGDNSDIKCDEKTRVTDPSNGPVNGDTQLQVTVDSL